MGLDRGRQGKPTPSSCEEPKGRAVVEKASQLWRPWRCVFKSFSFRELYLMHDHQLCRVQGDQPCRNTDACTGAPRKGQQGTVSWES